MIMSDNQILIYNLDENFSNFNKRINLKEQLIFYN